MRAAAFAKRNLKELLRDPLTLFFGLGFPLVLLVLMNVIQRNVPVHIFELETLAPGIALFGLTFLALFSGLLLDNMRQKDCRDFEFKLQQVHEQFLRWTA